MISRLVRSSLCTQRDRSRLMMPSLPHADTASARARRYADAGATTAAAPCVPALVFAGVADAAPAAAAAIHPCAVATAAESIGSRDPLALVARCFHTRRPRWWQARLFCRAEFRWAALLRIDSATLRERKRKHQCDALAALLTQRRNEHKPSSPSRMRTCEDRAAGGGGTSARRSSGQVRSSLPCPRQVGPSPSRTMCLTFATASVRLRRRRSFSSIRAPPSTSSISSTSSSQAARAAPDRALHGPTGRARGRACQSPRFSARRRTLANVCMCDCARPCRALCMISGGLGMSDVCSVVWYTRRRAVARLKIHLTPL